MALFNSPFSPHASALDTLKFHDSQWTITGERRASIMLERLDTLWFNTGTLCELACAACYLESSPANDTLVYLSAAEVVTFLDEIRDRHLPTQVIGLTGGEPFLNPEIIAILDAALTRSFQTVVLTNALRAMRSYESSLIDLQARFGDQLTLRIGLDHYDRAVHEAERGVGTWGAALAGLSWSLQAGLRTAVNGRCRPGESEADVRAGFAALFRGRQIGLDANAPTDLLLLPEMDSSADTTELGENCWSELGRSRAELMCCSSRMVVHRRGERAPRVAACPLLPYEPDFDLGATLTTARRRVTLNHPHCARFCLLGGGRLHA